MRVRRDLLFFGNLEMGAKQLRPFFFDSVYSKKTDARY